MSQKFDVIIVGAGPAGAISAYTLAKKGLRTLILEKEKLPRYKVCGGALQHKVLNVLPFDISPVIEASIFKFDFSYRLGNLISKKSNKPLMYCIRRECFDSFLVEKAIEQGAIIFDDHHVISLNLSNKKIKVVTKTSEFECDVLVGADGANSIVANSVNCLQSIEKSLGIQYEMIAKDTIHDDKKETVLLDWGSLPSGYAWLFPKSGFYSVGAGGPLSIGKTLKPYLKRFIEYSNTAHLTPKHFRGHILPSRGLKTRIVKGTILLTGDSAGLVDPFTGEGIYQALVSGQFAANSIIKYLSGESDDLSEYEVEVNREIMDEIMASKFIMHLFNSMPHKAHNLVDSSRIWGVFCRILRGEKTFRSIKRKLGPLSTPIESVAYFRSKKKILNFDICELNKILERNSR